jgi:lipid-A-disaccharide synthase
LKDVKTNNKISEEMKYYIIAGEASGDLHGSNLMKALRQKDPAAEFRFWGGDLMKAQGGTLVKHYRDLAFMGFLEVVMNLRTILNNIKFCKEDILNNRPDVLILVDYPGFNLRIARFAKELGIRVVYYISPQLWAWKEGRVEIIKNM